MGSIVGKGERLRVERGYTRSATHEAAEMFVFQHVDIALTSMIQDFRHVKSHVLDFQGKIVPTPRK